MKKFREIFNDKIYQNVYVFGAGASFNTHPTIVDFFPSVDEALNGPDNLPFEKYRELLERMRPFGTPDGYAKSLSTSTLTNEVSNEYPLIKEFYNDWIIYFTCSDFYPGVHGCGREMGLKFQVKEKYDRILQGIVIDKRYSEFFRSLKLQQFKNTIFYTWNYDRSLEYGLRLTKNSRWLNRVIHFNGHASDPDELATHSIKFFWESPSLVRTIPRAKNYIFVGYSFPGDNYPQDKNFLRVASEFKGKVIVQNPEFDLERMQNLFTYEIKDFKAEDIQLITDVKSFFIPG